MKPAVTLPVLLTLGFFATAVQAADQPLNWLKGLDTVKLNINISKELVDAGAQGQRLRQQTELQLRQAGIKVDPSAASTVYVEIVGCRGPGTNNFAAVVHISVNDGVEVQRNNEAIITQVWGPDLYVLYLAHSMPKSLLETTEARMSFFLNDWLQANPR
jgi:hypothetical protein